MLDSSGLTELARTLRRSKVLSLYLAGVGGNPAERDAWRVRLKGALAALEKELAAATHAERAAFEQAAVLAWGELEGGRIPAAARGWVAFITPDKVHHATALPVSVPTSAVWQYGPSLGTYLRALPSQESVIVTVVDSKRARIFRWSGTALETVATVRSRRRREPASRARSGPAGVFHTAVRGATGSDLLSRRRVTEREELDRELTERLLILAGERRPVVIGGTPIAARAAWKRLEQKLPRRVVMLASLGDRASEHEVIAAAAEGTERLARARQMAAIAVAAQSASGGPMARGAAAVFAALREGRVTELLLSRKWIEQHPASADAAILDAFDTGVRVEELTEGVGERLTELGGIAARLRFVPHAVAVSA